MTAAGRQSMNYGAVLPWWDMLFGTADFSPDYVATGDPTAEEALATGSYRGAAMGWAAAHAARWPRPPEPSRYASHGGTGRPFSRRNSGLNSFDW